MKSAYAVLIAIQQKFRSTVRIYLRAVRTNFHHVCKTALFVRPLIVLSTIHVLSKKGRSICKLASSMWINHGRISTTKHIYTNFFQMPRTRVFRSCTGYLSAATWSRLRFYTNIWSSISQATTTTSTSRNLSCSLFYGLIGR